MQQRTVECVGQRFDAQRCQQRMREHGSVARVVPQHCAEAARIVVAQRPVLELQVDVIVAIRSVLRAGIEKAEISRHAQVNDERAAPEIEQQVFATPRDRNQLGAGDALPEFVGHTPSQSGFTHDSVANGSPEYALLEAATNDFDLGEFRHGVADRGAGRARIGYSG